jgi:hypothetical protein
MSIVSSHSSAEQLNRVIGKMSSLIRFMQSVDEPEPIHEVDVDLMVKLHNKSVSLALLLVSVVERSSREIQSIADVSFTSVSTPTTAPVSTASVTAAVSSASVAVAINAEHVADVDPDTPKGLVPTLVVSTPLGRPSVLLADESGLTPVPGFVPLSFRGGEPATPATTVATDFTTGE